MAPVIKSGDEIDESIITEANTADVSTIDPDMQIFDLYSVRPNPEHQVQPFIHHLNILANEDAIKVRANFDDGALANAMSIMTFNKVKKTVRTLQTIILLATDGRWKPHRTLGSVGRQDGNSRC